MLANLKRRLPRYAVYIKLRLTSNNPRNKFVITLLVVLSSAHSSHIIMCKKETKNGKFVSMPKGRSPRVLNRLSSQHLSWPGGAIFWRRRQRVWATVTQSRNLFFLSTAQIYYLFILIPSVSSEHCTRERRHAGYPNVQVTAKTEYGTKCSVDAGDTEDKNSVCFRKEEH